MRRKFSWWWAVAAYMILIFTLSSFSRLPQPEDIPGFDKGEHYLEYGGLAVFAFLAIRASRKKWALWTVMLAAAAIASAYGAIDELHQRFVPGRTSDILDWLSDSLGAATGAVLAAITVTFRQRKERDLGDSIPSPPTPNKMEARNGRRRRKRLRSSR